MVLAWILPKPACCNATLPKPRLRACLRGGTCRTVGQHNVQACLRGGIAPTLLKPRLRACPGGGICQTVEKRNMQACLGQRR